MTGQTVVERLAARERVIVVACLLAVAAAGWIWLVAEAGAPDASMSGMSGMEGMENMPGMEGMAGMAMHPMPWTPTGALRIFLMWWIMMVAMMLPSAAPAVLLFAALERRRRRGASIALPASMFAGGYLLTWGLFSLAAVIVHWMLDRAGLLSPAMATTDAMIGGALLVAAGLYELTPAKSTCLTHCRSPLEWLGAHWRPGLAGALRMGMGHGLWCVGCCFMLMALLFYAGVMNLAWVAGLAVYVLVQKLAPGGPWIARAGGLALALAGVAVIWRAALAIPA
jgi:predicted metal-binding membrane protein